MAKGMFTQGLAVLFERAPALDAITAALDVPVLRRLDEDAGWISGPSVVVAHRPELNGYVSIDVVDAPWPDSMGSPTEDPDLFGAWSMGFFGPFAFPENLLRATRQAWHLRESPEELANRHRAFARVRLSYVFGADEDAPVMPEGVDPVRELEQLHALARRLLAVPGALAIFNPNAEMLLTPDGFDRLAADARASARLPIDTWMNVRFYRLDGLADGWAVMDTVGLAQLDRTELEACFPASVQPGEVATFLKRIALYLAGAGDVIAEGHTVDGPGGSWRATHREESIAAPPRDVVRLTPVSAAVPPALAR